MQHGKPHLPEAGNDGPRSADSHLDLGQRGEQAALASYRAAGYRLIARNWRCSIGELDLVLSKGSILVFCEVKTRRGAGMGGPHEAVTWQKRRKLEHLAESFLTTFVPSAGAAVDVRFDVASVSLDRNGRLSVYVFEGAF